VQFAGSSAWQKQVFDIAGALSGLSSTRNWSPSVAGDSEFETKYFAAVGEKPDTYAAIGYQTAWLIASVVKMAKDKGVDVNGTGLAGLMVDAATGPEIKEHGPILDFQLQRSGVPVYPGVPVKFADDGSIVALG
jgi:hypothetical protein